MYCSKCGNLSDNSSFCDKCGASFATSVAVPVQNSTSYKDSSIKYKIIIIVLLVILLALLVILLFFKKNNSDSDSPLTGGSRTVMIYASPTNLESDVFNFCNILEGNVPIIESFRLFVGQIWYTIALYTFSIVAGTVIVALQGKIEK